LNLRFESPFAYWMTEEWRFAIKTLRWRQARRLSYANCAKWHFRCDKMALLAHGFGDVIW